MYPKKSFVYLTFPSGNQENIKFLKLKKKITHKRYKTIGSPVDYYTFSNLRAQCKAATKKSLKGNIHNTWICLMTNSTNFWNYVRNKGKGSGIPEEMHLWDTHVSGPQTSHYLLHISLPFINHIIQNQMT